MTRARSNSVSALTETRALNGKAVSFSRAAEEERVRAGRGTRRHDGIRSYVASFAFFAETNSFTTPRRPLRRLTDSPRAFPRRDAQLPDAAFCCATRIIYLWKETGFFRGQSRRSFARRYLRTVFFSEEKKSTRRLLKCVRSEFFSSFLSRAVGLAIVLVGFGVRPKRGAAVRRAGAVRSGPGRTRGARPTPGLVSHALYALFVLALLVHVPLVPAPPREEVVRLPAIVERDQEVRAEVPVREVHLRSTQLLLRGVHGGTHRNEEDARCVHSRVAM